MKKNTVIIGAAVVGGIILLSALNNSNDLTKGLTDQDIELLNTSASNLSTLIKNDTSPVIFTVTGNAMTPEQRVAALAALNDKFSADMTALAATLQQDPNLLGNAFISIMSIKNGVVREDALKTFLAMFTAYSTLFNNATIALGDALGKITYSAGVAINGATTCAQWTFTKDTTYDVTQTSTHSTTVTYGGSTNSILFGIFGKKKTQTSTYFTFDQNIISEHKTEAWVPHCTSTVVDVDQVAAILTSQKMATIAAYGPIQSILGLAPNIEKFVQV